MQRRFERLGKRIRLLEDKKSGQLLLAAHFSLVYVPNFSANECSVAESRLVLFRAFISF